MKNIVILLMSILVGSSVFSQVDGKAEQLLDEVSKKMNTYENIYVEFKYKLHNAEENVNQETRGNATLKGDLYHLNYMGTEQIFDGKKPTEQYRE